MRATFHFSTAVLMVSLAVCALVNPGNFGTVDTTRRLQVERWIRLGEPPVRPSDSGFGITGRDGVRHAYYGIGQSLVLAPFDALVSAAVPPLSLDAVKRQQLVELLIAFLMQAVLTFATLWMAFQVLLSFQFPPFTSAFGAFAMLFGTLCLQYVQCAQENLLLLVLTLSALYAVRRWQTGGETRWAVAAGLACGYAILVRLPCMPETGVLPLFAIAGKGSRRRFLSGYAPPILAALVSDRWYHWHRFGELFSTYTGIVGRQLRPAGAPASFPFSYPFWKGFLGTLFSPDKSIFLFDPLLLVLILVCAWKWREIGQAVRFAILWSAILLLAYMAFYATYFDFGGDVAWGHRFVTHPVELLCLWAVPLLLRFAATLPTWVRRTAWTIVAAAVLLQALSTTIAPGVEIIQREHGDRHGVIANRVVNLAAIARGRLESPRFTAIPREWRALYYLPFQLRFRFPQLAGWAIAAWMALLVFLTGLVLATLRRVGQSPGSSRRPVPQSPSS